MTFILKICYFKKNVFYIDFEYSGLDDPAKLYSVYFLQPEYNLKYSSYKQIINDILFFKSDQNILEKIEFLMPIIYLRWSLLLLNIFGKLSKQKIKFSKKDINFNYVSNLQIKKLIFI